MTSISAPMRPEPRSLARRRLSKAWSKATFTLFAAGICGIFILPLIYMFSAAFNDSNTISTAGSPLYPAVAKQYDCTNPDICQYQTGYWTDSTHTKWVVNPGFTPAVGNLDLFQINGSDLVPPTKDGVKEYALLQDLDFTQTGRPSTFLDPATGNKVYTDVSTLALARVWQFHITTSNFFQAGDWANTVADGGFLLFFRNTAIIAVIGTIGAVISAIIVAFGFARFKIPGRDILFMVLIGTILLPFQVVLIPSFIIYGAIGWTGSWLPLIVPHFFSNAYNVFLLRQYFMTLPRELDEAAMMDGASPVRILISVIIPQSWPAIISVVLFHFFFAWNDFLGPLIYLTGHPDLYPIAIGLNYFNTTFRTANAPAAIQAGALMALVIPVIIFFIAQRVFMRGVVISGVEK
jgi:multiple sugar transport system permease protein